MDSRISCSREALRPRGDLSDWKYFHSRNPFKQGKVKLTSLDIGFGEMVSLMEAKCVRQQTYGASSQTITDVSSKPSEPCSHTALTITRASGLSPGPPVDHSGVGKSAWASFSLVSTLESVSNRALVLHPV